MQINKTVTTTARRAQIVRAAVETIAEVGSHLRAPDGKQHTSASVQKPSVLGLEPILRHGQHIGEFRAFDVRAPAVIIRGALDAAAQRISG